MSSSNGLTNGNAHYAESSSNARSAAPTPSPPPPVDGQITHDPLHIHDQHIIDHIFQSGFQSGNYADTILHVYQNVYRLHAIILSRSPYLAHLMSTSPQTPMRTVYINLEHEPQVTPQGFTIALSYLYSSQAVHQIQPENARAVLAAGCLLGGMEDLCQYAFEVCKRSISPETIGEWVDFVDAIPPLPDQPTDLASPTMFGQYAHILREYAFDYLVITLPSILLIPNGAPSDSGGRDALLQIYSRVPFDMFKAAVESPSFKCDVADSVHTRFKFAKDCIDLRKRGIARGTGAEETVVLAFGGESGGGIHITRKLRKRPLWKVNP